eukprot:COSAG03_NODE_867_length_5583_cov_35.557826_5_plen_287_part_00
MARIAATSSIVRSVLALIRSAINHTLAYSNEQFAIDFVIRQAGLKAAGCTNDYIAQWCAGATRSAFAGSRLLTQADGERLNGWIDGSGRAAAAQRSWALCFSSFSDPHLNPEVFHRQCDAHNITVSVARNALNFSFGGFATSSWSKASCCANPVNDCGTVSCFVNAETGASDFIFRLRPGTPTKYGITGSNEYYQDVNPNQWPQWGMFGHDLSIGGDYLNAPSAAPGAYGECTQGNTYQGAPGQVCGGKNNWGVEVGDEGGVGGDRYNTMQRKTAASMQEIVFRPT